MSDSDGEYERRKRARRDRSRDRDDSRDRDRRRDRSRDRSRDRDREDRDRDRSRRENKGGEVSSSSVVSGGIIKAMVTENNGEISCSVEETNRIRALLGLKPLNTARANKEQEAVDNFHNAAKEREAAELRKRLEESKERRELRAKLEGKTLADVDKEKEGELLSAADWVKRSRIKAKEESEIEKAKRLAELNAKRLQEEEDELLSSSGKAYTSADLKGLQVMHGVKDFEEGQEVILTLADSNILETGEHGKVLGLKEEGDILENVNMTEAQKRIEREKREKKLRQPVYSGYDDEEFAEGVAPGTRRSILSQYDKEKKIGPKLVLGEAGAAADTGAAVELSATDKAKQAVGKILDTLKSEKKEMSDYYSKAEFASFKQPKIKKKKEGRRIRKKDDDLDDDEGKSSNLEAILEGGEVEPSDAERGSRTKGSGAAAAVSRLEAQRKEGYQRAVVAAGEKTMKAFAGASRVAEPEPEDDAEIALSLARARRLALQQQRQQDENDAKMDTSDEAGQSASNNGIDTGAARARELMLKAQQVAASFNGGINESKTAEDSLLGDLVDAEGRRADGKLVFTDTTEFTSRLQARLTEKARERAEAAVKEQLRASTAVRSHASSKAGAESEEPVEEWAGMDIDGEESGDDEESGDEGSNGNGDDEQLDFVHQQPLVGQGMAATLALLKGTGELGKANELAGRAKDTRAQDPSEQFGDVKLEYRDEFGRKLTQKEAFRQLCYKFHGYGPGKKKKEKRLKAMEQNSKLLTSKDSGTMKTLVRAQEATGKAHVLIQGGASNLASTISSADLLALRKDKEKGKNSSSKTASGAKGKPSGSSSGISK